MSIERQERSPSFRSRQKTAKVNHNSKQLPSDFFPKAFSQSPKKKAQGIPSAEQLEQWYERDDSKQKQGHKNMRISANRLTSSRIKLCAMQQTFQTQNKKQDYMNKVDEQKQKGFTLIRPKKVDCIKDKVTEVVQKKSRTRIQPAKLKESQQRLVRVIRSQSKSKRQKQNPQSQKQIFIDKKSVVKKQSKQLGVGFDGMVTFSRFK